MKQAELSRRERQVMIGMIASTDFLRDVEPILDLKWVQSRDAVTIMTWILEYYRKYEKAPGAIIQDIYYTKLKKKKITDAQAEVIEEALESLSGDAQDWDEEDLPYYLEQAVEYCQECQLQDHGEQIQNLTENGDRHEALILTNEFTPVDVIKTEGVIPFATDQQKINMFAARGNALIKYPGDLGNFLDPYMIPSAFVVYLAQNKGGKALRDNHSPVLTNKGWKDISKMVIGDTIYNRQGIERKVTGVFPQQGKRQCYRFTFNDGIFIDSDQDHIWTLQTYYQRYQKENRGKLNKQYNQWIDMSTQEIVEKYGIGKIKNGTYRPIFPRNASINFKEKRVDIPPYVLGLLLGDGGYTGGYVGYTTKDYCTVESIESFGYELNHTGFYSYRFKTKPENIKVQNHTDKNGRKVKGYFRNLQTVEPQYRLKTLLKKYGLWGKLSHEKYIPFNFLYTNKENRLEVLRGLMDTDGDVDSRGHLAFNSTSKQLIEDVAFIVRSLGGKVTIKPRNSFYKKDGKKIYGKKSYRAFITLNEVVFKISRKVNRQKIFVRTKERILHKIEKIGKYNTTCISTNDKNSLFITKDFIVTHNSFNLMDSALRAGAQGQKTLLFQAGDMTQEQMELRMAIYICQLSDQEMYCKTMYVPLLDCAHNQLGSCELDIRNNDDEGPFETEGLSYLQSEILYSELTEAVRLNPKHKPCYECLRQRNRDYTDFKGAIWYQVRPKSSPLDLATFNQIEQAHKKKFNSYFNAIQNIRLFSYPSDGLSMSIMERQYNLLAKDGFVGTVVVADYLDLFAPDKLTAHMQPRDQENMKWKRGRRFSQEYSTLFISASQSDAQGFDATLLAKKNFSEDRRKLDHVTGMIGLNMTTREKRLGLMRMNEVASRDTDGTKVINVMHRLQMGKPIVGSFF